MTSPGIDISRPDEEGKKEGKSELGKDEKTEALCGRLVR